ncbi:acid-sensing ion channel 2-like [Scyliorhinus torazame]
MDEKENSTGSVGSLQPSSIHVFANNSSLHGIRHIFVYGPMTMRRFMWTVVFIGSLGLLVMECAERVAFYFSYPHVAKLEEVATNNLVFPAVTICNLNEFRFSKLTVNDLYHAGELLGLLNVHLEIQSPQLADPIVLKALKKKADFTHYKPRIFNMREFYDRVGHSLKDMMLYCKFRGVRCTHKDFKTLCTAKICSLRFDFLWYDVVTKHHNLHLVMKLELALEWLKSMKKFNR